MQIDLMPQNTPVSTHVESRIHTNRLQIRVRRHNGSHEPQ
eukprot:COSAG02_NODE_62831_length_264_cov_149.981818_1_plen_39_part_10